MTLEPHTHTLLLAQLLIWSVPDCRRPPLCIATRHRANIFGVQILPQTNDTRLVSASMDHTVQLHSLDHPDVVSWEAQPGAARLTAGGGDSVGRRTLSASTRTYHCHTSRVKVRRGKKPPQTFLA